MIKRARRGHQGPKLAPKYKGIYGGPRGNNTGVFQGSAISAIRFVIYMDVTMEDYASMNRRSKSPTRIVRDRPREQARQLIRGTINIQDRTNEQTQGQRITRWEICETPRIRKGENATPSQKQRRIIKNRDTKDKEAKQERITERETDTATPKRKNVPPRSGMATSMRRNNPTQDPPPNTNRRRQNNASAPNRNKKDMRRKDRLPHTRRRRLYRRLHAPRWERHS